MKYLFYIIICQSIVFNSYARDRIKIVGSEVMYPLISNVGQTYGSNTNNVIPDIENTGTNLGFKLFCTGQGRSYLDIIAADRKIKKSEQKLCAKNGVKNIVEIPIGYNAIILGTNQNSHKYKLKLEHIFLALAKKVPIEGKLTINPYKKWSDIGAFLPDIEIKIYGPDKRSDLGIAFAELLMNKVCSEFSEYRNKKRLCTEYREGGHYVELKNKGNRLDKIKQNINHISILDSTLLDKNIMTIKAAYIDGEYPNAKNISNNDYPLTRKLIVYAKQYHFGIVSNLNIFIKELIGENAMGKEGYLIFRGLVSLSKKEKKQMRENVSKLLN